MAQEKTAIPGIVYPAIGEFAAVLEAILARGESPAEFLPQAETELVKLLAQPGLVTDLLADVLSGTGFPYQLFRTVDSHDFLIYRSPRGSFSLRLYVWVPDYPYRIHDHGSWGILGAYVNSIRITQYQRQDDGSTPDYVLLKEAESCVLQPGEACPVLPFDDGIHRTQCATDSVALSVHVYGRAMRKGYIHVFDADKRAVYRLGTPMLRKSLFAVQALGVLGKDDAAASATLEAALGSRRSLVRWQAAMALYRLHPDRGMAAIERALQDEDEDVRRSARHFLDRLASGGGAAAVGDALLQAPSTLRRAPSTGSGHRQDTAGSVQSQDNTLSD